MAKTLSKSDQKALYHGLVTLADFDGPPQNPRGPETCARKIQRPSSRSHVNNSDASPVLVLIGDDLFMPVRALYFIPELIDLAAGF
jgi:hypothetical protein